MEENVKYKLDLKKGLTPLATTNTGLVGLLKKIENKQIPNHINISVNKSINVKTYKIVEAIINSYKIGRLNMKKEIKKLKIQKEKIYDSLVK